jgi:hypothetical protein
MLNIFLFEEKIATLKFEFLGIDYICNNKINYSSTTKKHKNK